MTALPSKASLTGTNVTQGQFKTALDTVNDYLTGLLGADGTPATARAALGVINDTAPTYAQVVAALGFTPYSATSAGAKLDKAGDTMTGNLAIQNTAPTLTLVDTDNGVTKSVHHNGDLIGFLGNDANWRQYVNNAGQMWASNYGWLHDRFAHTTPLPDQGATADHGVRNYLGDVTVWQQLNCGYEVFNAGGGQHQVRYYIRGYNVTVNCDCNCNCGTCCFPLDTQITMADGSLKPVSKVAVGERVLSALGGESEVLSPIICPVAPGEITILVNGAVRMTREHLLRGIDGWLAVDLLAYIGWRSCQQQDGQDVGIDPSLLRQAAVGDLIVTTNGLVEIESLEWAAGSESETLMSFQLKGDRSFFANGYAVESRANRE
ncbi:MAG: hypothetical protein WBI20_02605 [Burkholderiaceae bacterium]